MAVLKDYSIEMNSSYYCDEISVSLNILMESKDDYKELIDRIQELLSGDTYKTIDKKHIRNYGE